MSVLNPSRKTFQRCDARVESLAHSASKNIENRMKRAGWAKYGRKFWLLAIVVVVGIGMIECQGKQPKRKENPAGFPRFNDSLQEALLGKNLRGTLRSWTNIASVECKMLSENQ